jgi:phage shock protein A
MEDRIDQLRCPWDGLGEAHQEILDRAEAKANNGNFPLIEQILNAYAALEADLQEARAERDGLMEQAADVREQLEQAVGEITDLQQQLDLYRDAYGPLAAQRVGELTQASEAACAVDEEPY